MRVISYDHDIFRVKSVNIVYFPSECDFWKWPGFASELCFKSLDMIAVYVRVSNLDDELVGFGSRDVCNHVC